MTKMGTYKLRISILSLLWFFACTGQIIDSELAVSSNEKNGLEAVGYLIDGKKEGEWRFFRKDRLFSIRNYKNGVQHGKETSFELCSGRVLEEGYYDNGTPVGLWYWFTEGKIVYIRKYENGEPTTIYQNLKLQTDEEFPLPPSPRNIPKEYEDLQ